MDVTDEPIDPKLDRLFDLLGEEDREQMGPAEHPDAAMLSAHHARQLSTDQTLRVQEHFAVCLQCREQFLEYSQFMQSPAENLSSFEEAAIWKKLREHLTPGPKVHFWGSLGAAYSLAATLALTLVGVSLYTSSLLEELKRPITNVGFETLKVEGAQRSGSPGIQEVRLPNFLVLVVPSTRSFQKYKIDFRDERGHLIHSVESKVEEDGSIRILLQKHSLDSGICQVEVLGIQGESQERLGIYDVRIVV